MKLEVSKEFVLQAYNSACNEWKSKIEKEFPTLFHDEIIGKMYLPSDNSYCIRLQDRTHYHNAYLAGNQMGEPRKECLIISNPYINDTENGEREFIDVLYKHNTYRVMYFKSNIINTP